MRPTYYISYDNAQIVSFGAKIVVGCLVPQISSLISLVSTSNALTFFFFGDLRNLVALASDTRWYPSVRKHHSQSDHNSQSVHLKTWLLIVVALVVSSLVLLTDLLLFQLSDRTWDYKLKASYADFTITDSSHNAALSSVACPDVIYSNATAQEVFGDNTYASADGGYYNIYEESQRDVYLLDGPMGVYNVTANSTGFYRCTVVHMVEFSLIRMGVSPVSINCFQDLYYTNTSLTSIPGTMVPSLGITGQKVVSFFQSDDGAHYLFVELVQRVSDHFHSYNETTGVDLLNSKMESLKNDGYVMKMSTSDQGVVDMTSNTLNETELMSRNVNYSISQNKSYATTSFLHSKTEVSYTYGMFKVYTKKFIYWGTNLEVTFFKHGGEGDFYSYSYNTRQLFIKNGTLRENLYGIYSNGIKCPQSPQFSTDLSDDEIILATLKNPKSPKLVLEQEMVDVVPGMAVISLCGLFVMISTTIHIFHRRLGYKRLSFDIHLEIVHKALENLNPSKAWYLPAKLEATDNVVMTKGLSLVTNTYTLGLTTQSVSSGVEMSATNVSNAVNKEP